MIFLFEDGLFIEDILSMKFLLELNFLSLFIKELFIWLLSILSPVLSNLSFFNLNPEFNSLSLKKLFLFFLVSSSGKAWSNILKVL